LDLNANLDAFMHQVGVKSLNDQLARGVVLSLSGSKLDAAAPILIKALQPPHATFTRNGAIRALNTLALDSPDVHNALMALLTQPNPATLQEQAARTLAERKDKAALPALRDLATKTTNGDVRQAATDAADALDTK
jgi:HEAT repeat protein